MVQGVEQVMVESDGKATCSTLESETVHDIQGHFVKKLDVGFDGLGIRPSQDGSDFCQPVHRLNQTHLACPYLPHKSQRLIDISFLRCVGN